MILEELIFTSTSPRQCRGGSTGSRCRIVSVWLEEWNLISSEYRYWRARSRHFKLRDSIGRDNAKSWAEGQYPRRNHFDSMDTEARESIFQAYIAILDS